MSPFFTAINNPFSSPASASISQLKSVSGLALHFAPFAEFA
jgi:hypothetical protein